MFLILFRSSYHKLSWTAVGFNILKFPIGKTHVIAKRDGKDAFPTHIRDGIRDASLTGAVSKSTIRGQCHQGKEEAIEPLFHFEFSFKKCFKGKTFAGAETFSIDARLKVTRAGTASIFNRAESLAPWSNQRRV